MLETPRMTEYIIFGDRYPLPRSARRGTMGRAAWVGQICAKRELRQVGKRERIARWR